MPHKTTVEVGRLHAKFYDLLLPFGLVVDEVDLNAEGATLDQHPFRIGVPQPGKVTVRVSQENLQKFIVSEAPPNLEAFEIRLHEGKVYVEADAKMVIKLHVKARCNLEIVEGRKLYVRLEEVELLGVGAKGLVEKQLEKLNPVLDVADFPFDLILESVHLAEGQVVLKGTATI